MQRRRKVTTSIGVWVDDMLACKHEAWFSEACQPRVMAEATPRTTRFISNGSRRNRVSRCNHAGRQSMLRFFTTIVDFNKTVLLLLMPSLPYSLLARRDGLDEPHWVVTHRAEHQVSDSSAASPISSFLIILFSPPPSYSIVCVTSCHFLHFSLRQRGM